MFKTLRLEKIGNPGVGILPCFVNEVLGFNSSGLEEVSLKGQVDYSQANSVGSRGVYVFYFLKEGRIYHISSPKSWKKIDEYYCFVKKGKIIRLSFEQVLRCFEKKH